MPLQYKINVLAALKEKGYNTNRIRTEGLLSQSTLQKLREGKGVAWENLEKICELLECQPADIIEFVPAPKAEEQVGAPFSGISFCAMPIPVQGGLKNFQTHFQFDRTRDACSLRNKKEEGIQTFLFLLYPSSKGLQSRSSTKCTVIVSGSYSAVKQRSVQMLMYSLRSSLFSSIFDISFI